MIPDFQFSSVGNTDGPCDGNQYKLCVLSRPPPVLSFVKIAPVRAKLHADTRKRAASNYVRYRAFSVCRRGPPLLSPPPPLPHTATTSTHLRNLVQNSILSALNPIEILLAEGQHPCWGLAWSSYAPKPKRRVIFK
jgi:hypothetical protein